MIAMKNRGKRAAAIVADAGLALMSPALERGTVPKAPRVLVIRADHIGDAVMATAVLRPLREALRPSMLDVLAGPWAAPIFENHPAVDRVITYATPWWSAARGATRRERLVAWSRLPSVIRQIRAARYDVGVDLRGDLRQITFFLATTGIPVRVSSDRTGGRKLLTHVWPFDATRHEVEKNGAVAALLGARGEWRLDVAPMRASGPAGHVVLAIAGTEAARSWPTHHAAAFAEALHHEFGLPAVYVGAAKDVDAGDAIARLVRTPFRNLAGRTTLLELGGVLQRAALTVAVDSGPMHLAAAVGSPIVALFGGSDPRVFGPWSRSARIVSGPSVNAIEPDSVLAAVRSLYDRAASRSAVSAMAQASTAPNMNAPSTINTV